MGKQAFIKYIVENYDTDTEDALKMFKDLEAYVKEKGLKLQYQTYDSSMSLMCVICLFDEKRVNYYHFDMCDDYKVAVKAVKKMVDDYIAKKKEQL